IGEVELDGAGHRIDVEIEVVLAGDVGAGPHVLLAGAARHRPIRILEYRQELAKLDLLPGGPLGRNRLRARAQAALLPHLAADQRRPLVGEGLLALGSLGGVLHLVSRVVIHGPSPSRFAYSRSPAPPAAPEENTRALAARSSGWVICRSKFSMRPIRS